MTFNRGRNIYTSGDFYQYPNPIQQIKLQKNRRQRSDPFERDPFKIQSYNFHYAERPSYPLPHFGNQRSATKASKGFETFFYNYDFSTTVHDKENLAANNFCEYRYDSASSPRYMSAGQSYDQRPLCKTARSTANREYMRAFAAAHFGTKTISKTTTASPTSYFGRAGHCSNRKSIERGGRRLLVENIGGGGGGSGCRVGCDNERSHNIYGRQERADRRSAWRDAANFRELSSSIASPSKYNAREEPAQKMQRQASTHHRKSATLQKTEADSSSGCQININIKSLDSTQLADNIVIKIEADNGKPSCSETTAHTEQSAVFIGGLNNLNNSKESTHNHSKDIAYANSDVNCNLDIKPSPLAPMVRNCTSANFSIDKRLSKFEMMPAAKIKNTVRKCAQQQRRYTPRSSSHCRIPVTSSSNVRAQGFNNPPNNDANRTEKIQNIDRQMPQEERMPSIVPWCLNATVCQAGLYGSSNVNAAESKRSLRTQRSCTLSKHMRPSYDAATNTLSEMWKMRRQAVMQADYTSRPPQQHNSAKAASPLQKRHRAENIAGEVSASRMQRMAWRTHQKSPSQKSLPSQHSLCSLRISKSTLQSQAMSSQAELYNSPSPRIMHSSKSRIRTEEFGVRRPASVCQSHLSTKTTPLNININVFADKLKLLRV